MYNHTSRKPDGYAVSTDLYGKTEADTQQCCHCSQHFNVVAGSGKQRGFCLRCMKITCGAPACHEHFSFEERMTLYEKGLLPDLLAPREAVLPKHQKIILPD